MKGIKCIIFVVFSFLPSISTFQRYFYIRTDADKGVCKYEGYQPGGNEVEISPIISPTAKLESNILAAIAGWGGKGSLEIMHISKFSEALTKIAPKLAPALGTFGVGMGVVADLFKPSPQDILDATNKAIKKLTEEVNNKFIDLQGYVDGSILQTVKKRINLEYDHMMTYFKNCINEPTKDRVLECQEDANRYIRAGANKFMVHNSEVNSLSESNLPDNFVKIVKEMEVTFLPFRKYVTMDLMQLKTLADTYKDTMPSSDVNNRLTKKYLKEISEDAQKFMDYADKISKWIFYAHDTLAKKECHKQVKCGKECVKEGNWVGYTACYCYCKCRFDPTMLATQSCEKHVTVRADDKKIYQKYDFGHKLYTWSQAGQFMAKKFLNKAYEEFLPKQNTNIRNYWQSTILSSKETWQKYKDQADEMRNELNRRSLHALDEKENSDEDDGSSDSGTDDDYSARHQERLEKALDEVKKENENDENDDQNDDEDDK